MTTPIDPGAGQYRLMTWLSPSFPVGAYSYSHGIEYAIESGNVCDGESLQTWISGILDFGTGRTDAILFRAAWKAVYQSDDELLAWAIETAATFRPTREMALESSAQGTAFLEALITSWPDAGLVTYRDCLVRLGRAAEYPVTVGVATALSKIDLLCGLGGYLHALISNLVSAGIRSIPLGQTAGQSIISALEGNVLAMARTISRDDFDRLREDFGSAAAMVDWTSMKHETQYTRIFRS